MDKIFIKTGDPALVGLFANFDKMLVLRNKQIKLFNELQLSLVHHKYCVPADSTVEGKVEINEKRLKVLRRIFRVLIDKVYAEKPANSQTTNRQNTEHRYWLGGPDAAGVYQFEFADLEARQLVRMTLPEMRAVINYAVPRLVNDDRMVSAWFETRSVNNWEKEPIDDNQNESAGSKQ